MIIARYDYVVIRKLVQGVEVMEGLETLDRELVQQIIFHEVVLGKLLYDDEPYLHHFLIQLVYNQNDAIHQ